MQSEIITIVIPPGMWLDVDQDGSRLKCVISVNGTLMHLDAIQVYYARRERRQRPVARRLQEDFELLCRYGSEGSSRPPTSTANPTSSSQLLSRKPDANRGLTTTK